MLKIFLVALWLLFSVLRGCGGLRVEKKLQKVLAVSELAVPLQPQTGKRPTAPRAPAGARAGPGEKNRRKICTSQIFGLPLQHFRLTLQK